MLALSSIVEQLSDSPASPMLIWALDFPSVRWGHCSSVTRGQMQAMNRSMHHQHVEHLTVGGPHRRNSHITGPESCSEM